MRRGTVPADRCVGIAAMHGAVGRDELGIPRAQVRLLRSIRRPGPRRRRPFRDEYAMRPRGKPVRPTGAASFAVVASLNGDVHRSVSREHQVGERQEEVAGQGIDVFERQFTKIGPIELPAGRVRDRVRRCLRAHGQCMRHRDPYGHKTQEAAANQRLARIEKRPRRAL